MKNAPDPSGICARIGQVRRELHGHRGKARFCKQLGISPSTYNYYEASRVPTADLLVKIADVAGVDLRWLLTGQAAEPAVPADHPAVRRVAALLAEHPDAAVPLTAFVEMLAETMKWPSKEGGAATAGQESPGRQDRPGPPTDSAAAGREWIPIIGRSAAGVPQFWADAEDGRGVTVLAELIDRYAGREVGQLRPAVTTDQIGAGEDQAQLITLSEPDEANVAEFVAAAALKQKYGDAFAVRIDGNSMAPEIRHSDVVVCSPSHPAADGRAAIVQLAGQIGVTCKLFRREGDTVHLVPVNEQYPPQSFPANKCVWALRVLARIRAE